MDDYIYTKQLSLNQKLCSLIINKFHEDNLKYKGVTAGGINENVKYSTDLQIREDDCWNRIRNVLIRELNDCMKEYFAKIGKKYAYDYIKVNCVPTELSYQTFQIQRYNKNSGKYIYHIDQSSDIIDKKPMQRVLTYLWYLNDVNEGGETTLFKDIKIKPETGKLLLFPSTWTFPHRGEIPISNDKYIITGWVYTY